MTTDTTPDSPIPYGRRMVNDKPKSKWKLVLILIGLAAALCLAGGGLSYFAIVRGGQALEGPPKAATQTFLNALRIPNNADAYTSLCSTTKSTFKPVDLQSVKDYRIIDVRVQTVNGQRGAIVTVDITRTTGPVERHAIPLSKEGSQWLICGQPY